MFLDVFAFVVFGILLLAIVAAVVALGVLPGKIARQRDHPQADAITAAGWMGVASLGILGPLAFIWAFHRAGTNDGSQTLREAQALEQLVSASLNAYARFFARPDPPLQAGSPFKCVSDPQEKHFHP